MRLSDAELADLVARTWPDGVIPQTGLGIRQTAYAIARAESGGRTEAIGDGGWSYGIWQIYTAVHDYDPNWLMTAEGNAQAAYEVSGGGSNFNPWCTWESTACGGRGKGTYRQYLGEAGAALSGASNVWPVERGVTVPLPDEPAGISPITYGLVGAGVIATLMLLISSFGGGKAYLPQRRQYMPRGW